MIAEDFEFMSEELVTEKCFFRQLLGSKIIFFEVSFIEIGRLDANLYFFLIRVR